jgi:carboxyl-terminal processing protease
VILSTLVISSSFLFGFAASWFRSKEAQYPLGDTPERYQDDFRVYWEAWHLVEENFYREKPLDSATMIHGAIDGTVDSLDDRHTAWVAPERAAVLREDLTGTFQGIGATVNIVNGQLTIIKPLPNSPAEKAGLLSGDAILSVDGQSVVDMDLIEAVTLIRGPEGTSVRLGIAREQAGETKEFEVSVQRAELEFPTLDSEMLTEGIAYIQLNEFNGRANSEMRKALTALLRQKPRGLVLDLRNNPGGLLSQAVAVTSQFVDTGVVLIERRGVDGEEKVYEARRGGLAIEIPLAVLVNGSSASASEIVAGAIRDHERGILIGTTTFGKGSMQIPYVLSDDSSLILTIARWYTPDNHLIDGKGLEPDRLVEVTEDDMLTGQDVQLEAAVDYLLGLGGP